MTPDRRWIPAAAGCSAPERARPGLIAATRRVWGALSPLSRWMLGLSLVLGVVMAGAGSVAAQEIPTLGRGLMEKSSDPQDISATLETLIVLTLLTLAPSILIMATCFLRVVIVMGFVQRALSTQQIPPSQVITGFGLLLTFMIMRPTFEVIKEEAWVPWMDEEITLTEAYHRARVPMRNFLFANTRQEDIRLFLDISGVPVPETGIARGAVPSTVLVNAFVISELRIAFEMGFAIYLPFVVIDLVVASTLISMGMMVLPPVFISLPFKILLFVLVDGWARITSSLVRSFELTYQLVPPNAPGSG